MMTFEDRYTILSLWSGVISFGSALYLSGAVVGSVVVGVFVAVSCQLRFGARWLMRGSFLLALLAIAVSLGFPAPQTWAGLVAAIVH